MLLEQTIFQLDIGPIPAKQAESLGQLGYIQWLGALPGDASYPREAMRAYHKALPFRCNSPAVAVFCDLLITSTDTPLRALSLTLAAQGRRGGAQARRL